MQDNQKEFAKLTMELDLKTREYNMLCKELENVKDSVKFNKVEELENLKQQFQQKLIEIREIKNKLKQLSEK